MIGRGSDGSTGPRFPNGVFAVREADGSVALFEAGLRVHERSRSDALLEAPFYGASLAKQVTSYLIAVGVELGFFSYETSIAELLPAAPKAFRAVEVRHLIHHQAGLPPADRRVGALRRGDVWWHGATQDDVVNAVLAGGLESAPGSAYRYSNEGYWLLAEVLRRSFRSPVGEVAAEWAFRPAGMLRSSMFWPDCRQGLVGFHRSPVGGWEPQRLPFSFVGDGGLVTTLGDLLRWCDFLRRQTHGAVISQALQRRSVAGAVADGVGCQYGWGVSLREHRGARIESHGGDFIGFRAKVVRFLELSVDLVAFTDADVLDLDAASMAIADGCLTDQLDPDAPSWSETLSADGRAH